VVIGIIPRQAIKRGTFTPDKDIVSGINRFLDRWIERCGSFTRTKSPDDILAKAVRKGNSDARRWVMHCIGLQGVCLTTDILALEIVERRG
jgi:hypothetical protein